MAFNDVHDDDAPLLLLLAGNDDRASERWLGRWEAGFATSRRVTLGAWREPVAGRWLDRLNRAIQSADRPVVLVTHGPACYAVAWWVEHEWPAATTNIRAAVLHEPPVPDEANAGAQAAALGPYPAISMPFPACLLASRERGYAELASLRRLARQWDCHFDTIAERTVSRPREFKPVQSLGERFLAQVLNADCSMRPATAQAGYPFIPRER